MALSGTVYVKYSLSSNYAGTTAITQVTVNGVQKAQFSTSGTMYSCTIPIITVNAGDIVEIDLLIINLVGIVLQ